MTKDLAITNCRVSSDEQLKSNSLNRQRDAVLSAAERLGVLIPEDGQWSGSVSSMRGKNIKRKDIREMLEYCVKHKNVKYLIVDEPDRFMRSIDEAYYIEMEFKLIGVRVWYASDDDLNGDQLQAKLMKFMKYFVAEGSNEERQRKSINGQTNAGQAGRYTYCPKAGYMKGSVSGIHELHPERGPALRKVLKRLAAGLLSPTNALIELNNSPFTNNHAPYKMDKFEKIATNPYYAGIIVINKQVKVYNEHGLHEAIITLKEHRHILDTFNAKQKYQTGPNRNGNPLFPLNNIMEDEACIGLKNRGRLVGFKHSNGKYKKFYEKYRCRSCKRYWHKDEIHDKILDLFEKYEMSPETQRKIIDALEIVWQKDDENKIDEIASIKRAIAELTKYIEQKVESATNDSYSSIKGDILKIIDKKKNELSDLEIRLKKLTDEEDDDKKEFMEFALSFITDTGNHFLEPYVSKANRLVCKQMLFPAGIYINSVEKVYTPKVSVFYRGVETKTDTEVSEKVQLVRVKGL
ncbi:MAG: recombinase family protein [Candidatus Saccharimonadales bacterium]